MLLDVRWMLDRCSIDARYSCWMLGRYSLVGCSANTLLLDAWRRLSRLPDSWVFYCGIRRSRKVSGFGQCELHKSRRSQLLESSPILRLIAIVLLWTSQLSMTSIGPLVLQRYATSFPDIPQAERVSDRSIVPTTRLNYRAPLVSYES